MGGGRIQPVSPREPARRTTSGRCVTGLQTLLRVARRRDAQPRVVAGPEREGREEQQLELPHEHRAPQRSARSPRGRAARTGSCRRRSKALPQGRTARQEPRLEKSHPLRACNHTECADDGQTEGRRATPGAPVIDHRRGSDGGGEGKDRALAPPESPIPRSPGAPRPLSGSPQPAASARPAGSSAAPMISAATASGTKTRSARRVRSARCPELARTIKGDALTTQTSGTIGLPQGLLGRVLERAHAKAGQGHEEVGSRKAGDLGGAALGDLPSPFRTTSRPRRGAVP